MNSKSRFSQGSQLRMLSLLILLGAIAIEDGNPTFAQVTADPSLGTEVTIKGGTSEITGGTTVGNTNLFHSFSNFSVKNKEIASFLNAPSINNILVRVTGRNPSDIQGKLKTQGNANLFVINPNGIIFGRDALLEIGGSFIGTTASGIGFPGGGEFSITSPVNPLNPLLTVNPSALLFNQIASESISSIQVNKARLSVKDGQSLLLVGGDVKLEGGGLRATNGRVELGGLTSVGTVGLNMDSNNFRLSFPDTVALADVSVSEARVTASGSGSGSGIQLSGRRVTIADGSTIQIINDSKAEPGGTLTVAASELVEILERSSLLTGTEDTGDAGEIKIETGRLIVRDGAQVSTTTGSRGRGGKLSVTAKDDIHLIGTSPVGASGLFTLTSGAGDAGELKIEAGQLIVQDGARVSASTRGEGRGGKLSVTTDSIQLVGTSGNSRSGLFVGTENTGSAGDLEIETGQLVVQDSARISASTDKNSTGQGGSILVKTGELNVRDNAQVTVSSEGLGNAGTLTINANSIKLDNSGKLQAFTNFGEGGNINLQVRDLVSLRRSSQISAEARNNAKGGNITINAPSGFIVATPKENNYITANAFSGSGGRVEINATGVFGLKVFNREDLVRVLGNDLTQLEFQRLPSSITAISQTSPNLNGQVNLNTPDIDINRGLVALPAEVVDATRLIDQNFCAATAGTSSSFTITGRGGLPPSPNSALNSDAVWEDWRLTTVPSGDVWRQAARDRASTARDFQPTTATPKRATPEPIVEATGWVKNEKGEVVLTANPPTVMPHNSWLNPPSCH